MITIEDQLQSTGTTIQQGFMNSPPPDPGVVRQRHRNRRAVGGAFIVAFVAVLGIGASIAISNTTTQTTEAGAGSAFEFSPYGIDLSSLDEGWRPEKLTLNDEADPPYWEANYWLPTDNGEFTSTAVRVTTSHVTELDVEHSGYYLLGSDYQDRTIDGNTYRYFNDFGFASVVWRPKPDLLVAVNIIDLEQQQVTDDLTESVLSATRALTDDESKQLERVDDPSPASPQTTAASNGDLAIEGGDLDAHPQPEPEPDPEATNALGDAIAGEASQSEAVGHHE